MRGAALSGGLPGDVAAIPSPSPAGPRSEPPGDVQYAPGTRSVSIPSSAVAPPLPLQADTKEPAACTKGAVLAPVLLVQLSISHPDMFGHPFARHRWVIAFPIVGVKERAPCPCLHGSTEVTLAVACVLNPNNRLRLRVRSDPDNNLCRRTSPRRRFLPDIDVLATDRISAAAEHHLEGVEKDGMGSSFGA